MHFRAVRTAGVMALLTLILALGQASAAIDPQDMKNIMLVKDVKAGMTGYGKTVFVGSKPQTFNVKVLGVLKKANLGTELILVRLSGGPLTKRGASVIEGMSGSPIYINGKLVGAMAYGEAFAKEPIGLVTPIQYMLEALDPSLPSKPSSFCPFNTMTGGDQIMLDSGNGESATSRILPTVEAGGSVFRPLAIPIMVSGMSQRGLSRLSKGLQPLNLRLVAGPGMASDADKTATSLEPGSAVGVSLATGDVDISGIGTVTYRRGNRILAFGHPMFSTGTFNGIGAFSAPLMTAYVFEVSPSYMISSKVAAVARQVGSLTQDRPWGIAGQITGKPSMIPVTVRVNDKTGKRQKVFRYSVVDHPLLTSQLAAVCAAEGIAEMKIVPSDQTARVKFSVDADGLDTITRENTYFDPVSIDEQSVGELSQVLDMLQFNQFAPARVKKIAVEVDMLAKHQTARIERVFLRQGKYEPGQTVEVGVVLRPYASERITKTLHVKLPGNMPNGKATLQVSGGAQSRSMLSLDDDEISAVLSSRSSAPPVENLKQLVGKFLERNKASDLVARVVLPRPVPSIAGEKLPDLPPSIAEAMKSTRATAMSTEPNEIKTVVPTEWVIGGSQRLSITVQKRDASEKKAPEKRPSEPSERPSPVDIAEPPSGQASDDEDEEEEEPEFGMAASGMVGIAALVGIAAAPIEAEKPQAGQASSAAKPETKSPAKTEAKPAAKSSAAKPEKAVGRAPSVWKQTLKAEFLTGDMKNVSASTGDLLRLAASMEAAKPLNDTFVWSMAPDGKGGVFAGTGNRGMVYRMAADGSVSEFYDSPELEVHSLAVDAAGNLYLGTSPNGRIYKVGPDGKGALFFKAAEKYITALALDGTGSLYAATGDKCRVYRIGLDGKGTLVLDSPEASALCLAVDKTNNVYVGTGQAGIVYVISPSGAANVFYDSDQDAITALTIAPNGAVYAGSSPKGIIYRLSGAGAPKVVYDKTGKTILSMLADASGDIYAASSAEILRVMSDDTICSLPNKTDLQFMSLAETEGSLYVGTGNAASICRAAIGTLASGTYESPVHDCKRVSSWGVVRWSADLPKGTGINIETRTGNTAQPDSTWSAWSAPYQNSNFKVASPPGRFIQYRATLSTDDPRLTPRLLDASIVYLPANQAPKVVLSAPKGGEAWSGDREIKWTGSDPDGDTLSYQVFSSADGGATWTLLKDSPKPAKAEDPSEEEEADDEDETSADTEITPDKRSDLSSVTLKDVEAELDRHPEIPQSMREKILAEAEAMLSARPAEPAPSVADSKGKEAPSGKPADLSTKKTKLTWKTSAVKDGSYLLKVVATDRLSSPADFLTEQAVSEPITICNAKPVLTVFRNSVTMSASDASKAEIGGFASQSLVSMAGVQYRVESGEWAAAAASDGIFDTGFEQFRIVTEPLGKGKHTVEVKAVDAAGNSSSTKLDVTVK